MNLWIGFSALQASEYGINQVSQNLANANTEGYHRQQVGFETGPAQYIRGQFVGSGVRVSHVTRVRDQIVERAYTNTISDLKEIEQRLSIETRVESFFLTGEGTIQSSLTGFFDEMSRLSANPGERSLRDSVVNQANNLTYRIQEVSNGLVDLKHSISQQIDMEVASLNNDLEELAKLQVEIQNAKVQALPNNLLDQRDQLINKIAQQIDIQRYESVQDTLGLGIAGSSISIGVQPVKFETVLNEDGSKRIQVVGGDRETKFASGKIAALVDIHNNLIDDYSQKLETFTKQLIREVDQAHATGVGLDGPFSILRSHRLPTDVTLPLGDAGLPFPIEAGELFVSTTTPSGDRSVHAIAIDPSTDSLADIAARINSLDHINASLDSRTGKLSIIAQPGYGFDFTGSLETNPDLSGITGTTVPSLSGEYIGDSNERFTVTALGDGTIGKTPGLKAQVTDANGQIIKEINIGDGYEAGTPLEMVDGVNVSFTPGEIVTGDSFETVLIANPDTSGLLSALGLNSFFSGNDPTDIAVRSGIGKDTDALATSTTGEIGDTRNLADLISLRDAYVLGDGLQTFDDFLADSSAEIGFQVQSTITIQANIVELNFQYKAERDAISGVDVNEELVYLTQHQKSYEAAIQVVRTMEQMLDELFQMIR